MDTENQVKKLVLASKEDLERCVQRMEEIRQQVDELAKEETILVTRIDVLKNLT